MRNRITCSTISNHTITLVYPEIAYTFNSGADSFGRVIWHCSDIYDFSIDRFSGKIFAR
nr:MAG TPA: hypothetical protein [Caudoviricetes sp.]